MCVCVYVCGGCAQKQATVLFRFVFSAIFWLHGLGGSLPKWPSSNSSDIFRQLSDSQVWHPQHKAKVKWHRRSHRAGWAGNRQPAAGSNFAATQNVCSSFLYPFIFYLSFFSLSYAARGGRGDGVRQPPRQTVANPLTQPTTPTSTTVAFNNKIIEHQSIKISQVQHKLKDHVVWGWIEGS